jgi:hypothetical protein
MNRTENGWEYRIQIRHGGKWRTLLLRDVTVANDKEAVALVAAYHAETGYQYRAQLQTAIGWVNV